MPTKRAFLRSETSLMQTIGRAARNVNAKVILYADKMTESMQRAIEETDRRRALQAAYNLEHGITPETIRKGIHVGIESEAAAHAKANALVGRTDETQYITEEYLGELEAEMLAAAEALEFERAAAIRDRIEKMRSSIGEAVDEVDLKADDRPAAGAADAKETGAFPAPNARRALGRPAPNEPPSAGETKRRSVPQRRPSAFNSPRPQQPGESLPRRINHSISSGSVNYERRAKLLRLFLRHVLFRSAFRGGCAFGRAQHVRWPAHPPWGLRLRGGLGGFATENASQAEQQSKH